MEILEMYQNESGELKLVKTVRNSYFTRGGNARLKAVVTYSVYWIPKNADLDAQDYYSGTRKADALKAFKLEKKSFESLNETVLKVFKTRTGRTLKLLQGGKS